MCGDLPPDSLRAYGAVFKLLQPHITLNLCRDIEPSTHSTAETQTREVIPSFHTNLCYDWTTGPPKRGSCPFREREAPTLGDAALG